MERPIAAICPYFAVPATAGNLPGQRPSDVASERLMVIEACCPPSRFVGLARRSLLHAKQLPRLPHFFVSTGNRRGEKSPGAVFSAAASVAPQAPLPTAGAADAKSKAAKPVPKR